MTYKDPEEQRAHQRRYYDKNKKEIRRRAKDRRIVNRLLIDSHKDVPCVDCGERYPPWVMDFDHVRGKKEYELSRLGRIGAAREKILREIAKCDVVCSNCHRQRTHDRTALTGQQKCA